MHRDLYSLKEHLHQSNILFCFAGSISQSLVIDIVCILERRMKQENVSRTTFGRVFSVVVEKLQNMMHYSDETHHPEEADGSKQPVRQGIIAIGYANKHYFVLSGNIIRNTRIERLRQKLETIRNMNKAELKRYYLEQRRKEPEADSKGAGLGFIDIAKKAGQPIEYEFKPIDEETSFFSLKTVI